MEEKNFKIGAILKTSNAENTLCQTLESIKELDEIIVIDEHSNDDSVEILKEYKAKIIFANKNDLTNAQNQALQEITTDWILIVEQNEIIPQKLINELYNYIEKPKKNKNVITLAKKVFYLGKEIKSAREKKILRFFKKDYASFKNNYSTEIVLKNGKLHKLNKNFKKDNLFIYSYFKKDISSEIEQIIEINKIEIKNKKLKPVSIILKPINCFLYWYIIKRAMLDGKKGYIFAIKKALKEFLFEVMKYEKINSEENNDF